MINKIIYVLVLKIRRKYIKFTSKLRRRKISNRDFTIISNNCWGGFIYQSYGLEYKTPTLGLFFMADDYIKFISDIDKYLLIDDISEISIENSKYKDFLLSVKYKGIIGKIDDIEVMFMHYDNIEIATEKWNERKKRINKKNILYKFCEQNECREEHIKKFIDLKLDNKICFVSNKYKNLNDKNVYHINSGKITATSEPFGNSKIANINEIINNMKR